MNNENSNIKVLFYKPGASHEYGLALCNILVEKGIEVVMVCDNTFEVDALFKANFPVKKIFVSYGKSVNGLVKGVKYFFSLIAFLFLYIKFRPNIIHIQWLKYALVEYQLFRFLRKFGTKIVYTAHNVVPHEYQKKDISIYRKVYSLADSIIVHSDSTKNEIINLFGMETNRINRIRHGNFDFIADRFRYKKDEARRLLGLKENDKIILFFGLIRKYKGITILLNTFKELKKNKSIENLKLIIAGGGEHKFYDIDEDDLSYIQSESDILYDKTFCSFEKMGQYFCASDVSVLPYKNISASGILILSLAYGIPLIVTDVGGFPEYIIDNETGYIIPSDNEKALYDKIKMAFIDEKKLSEMSSNCKKYSGEKLSWTKIADDTIAVYKRVSHSEQN